MPPLPYLAPIGAMLALALGIVVVQRDLGAAVMQSILAIFLTRQYTASVDQQLASLPASEREGISEKTASILSESFGGAQVLAEQYPKYGDAIIEGARQAFIAGSGAAITVALIAVFLGLLVTWFGFPRKQQELDLEAEYAKET